MESEKLLSLYMQRVVGFVYVKSRRLFCNLTDMCQKPLACFSLCVDMVPKAYYHIVCNITGDPLENILVLPTHPPDFIPGLW
jgi:hypothetical protein